ncbi:alkylhydroperoxidase [Bordetella genomosp. 1]|uniref:Alkylhydroperoxidase n=1 Tax=Bordetella genomosp. 1 TaxID=1395607 RepID=A0A261RXC5_9BORD|nr:carboxymuconolactone decarboxylase family protein [Bordetella genomosp. 1]OZI29230.1 alkylhydroperoxidase [Bordetella genomosp. 1]
MARLTLHTPDTAPEATRPALQAAQQSAGFLSNLLAVLANAPVALEAYQTLSAINARASLTLPQREVVQLIAATTHGCDFCVAGHTALGLNKAKLPAAVVDALRAGQPLPDAQLEALARFTREVIATRGKVSDAVLADFLATGHTEGQALEVIVGIGLATICNFANVLAQTPLNPQLQDYEWHKQA